jgi:hypothetical protein
VTLRSVSYIDDPVCRQTHKRLFLHNEPPNLGTSTNGNKLGIVYGFIATQFLYRKAVKVSIMSFRKIRPSFGDSSASTSNPSQSTSESTGSDPRRARGEKELDSGTSSSKRRRVPESVTRNACLNCKKARAKVYSHLSWHDVPPHAFFLCQPRCAIPIESFELISRSVMGKSLVRGVQLEQRPPNVSTRSTSNMRRKNWLSRSKSSEPRTI